MLGYNQIHGSIEVVCGPMFSGKTEELIRRVRRAQIARLKVQIFKPEIDNRYDEQKIVSHSKQSLDGVAVRDASQILELINDSTRVVAVDEVQFFDPAIVDVVGRLANRGHRVICAGLDLDYMGQPFGEMPKLLATADEVLKVQAICTVCGSPATRSFRIIDSADQILVGEQHQYEARCRLHFDYDSPFYPQGQKNILAPFDEAAEQAQ